jgi:DNA-binding transcriptional LysR family regulator
MDPSSDMAVFVRVANAGSMSAAGRALGMSPAMVSKRIARLEARLGVRLLHRTTRRLHLTEEGAAFHERSARILADIEESEAAVSGMRGAPRGTLRFTAGATFARLHLGPLFPEFLARYPEVKLEANFTDQVVDIVDQGLDLAIRIAELRDSSLVARKLAPNRSVVCAAPGYLKKFGAPRHPRDLADHRCIILAQTAGPKPVWNFQGKEGPISVHVDGPIICNHGEVVRDAAIAGLGLAIKSTWDIGAELRAGRLKTVLDEYMLPAAHIYAVYPHSRHLSPKVRCFVDFLVERFSPVPPWERPLPRQKRDSRRP